jgi:4a-hydroxytetrahydrobiopterin dehydratase
MTRQTENGMLVREYGFNNFLEAVAFVQRITPLAEVMNHHPDILIHSYKKVKIMLMTHDE